MKTKRLVDKLKVFLILVLVVLNIGFLTTWGSSDTGEWSTFATASVNQDLIPSRIATKQTYPLFSSAIFSIFANFWFRVFGPSADYVLAMKLSVMVFYAITLIMLFVYLRLLGGGKKIAPIDILLVFFTTFSLIIHTQGLLYVDIYTAPTIIAGIIALYKRKYFLTGLLFAVTLTIKFEPILLIPMVGATIFQLQKDIKKSFGDAFRFAIGFLPAFILPWVIINSYPGGSGNIAREIQVLLKPGFLDPQALGFNWLYGYYLHLTNPATYAPLVTSYGINTPITSSNFFVTRYLFYLIYAVILLRYWLFMKKDVGNFLTASTLIYLSHYIINRDAHEQHLFYAVIMMLLLFLVRPTNSHRNFLILFDILNIIAVIVFYGITGVPMFSRVIYGFDTTIVLAVVFCLVYVWVLYIYLKNRSLNIV